MAGWEGAPEGLRDSVIGGASQVDLPCDECGARIGESCGCYQGEATAGELHAARYGADDNSELADAAPVPSGVIFKSATPPVWAEISTGGNCTALCLEYPRWNWLITNGESRAPLGAGPCLLTLESQDASEVLSAWFSTRAEAEAFAARALVSL